MKSKISEATVWLEVDGFGKRGKSTVHVEGIAMNQPMIIEIIDVKIESLLPSLKRMVDNNGLIIINEVEMIM